jgi:hypothetical protein
VKTTQTPIGGDRPDIKCSRPKKTVRSHQSATAKPGHSQPDDAQLNGRQVSVSRCGALNDRHWDDVAGAMDLLGMASDQTQMFRLCQDEHLPLLGAVIRMA